MTDYIFNEKIRETWSDMIEGDDSVQTGFNREDTIARALENQMKWCESGALGTTLNESTAPDNVTGGVAKWTSILMKMARRVSPNLVAQDVFGTQPLATPDGQIFALRARYDSQQGKEALVDEANTAHSGAGTHGGDSHGFAAATYGSITIADDTTAGTGMAVSDAEKLGSTSGNSWGKMAISIEKVAVSAISRGLYADYSHELRQDMQAVHGENVDNIMADVLVTEIMTELNREFIRTMNVSAVLGGVGTANAGVIDVVGDTDGTWAVERWKGLLFQIELERNAIAKATRRGRGNFVVCSSNVASALVMAGMLDIGGDNGLSTGMLDTDDTGMTVIGKLRTGVTVVIDPYATLDYLTVGYKGQTQMDAGIYYAPYTPLEMYRAHGEDTMQPRLAFKTRYALVANPFVRNDLVDDGNGNFVVTPKAGLGLGQTENHYYRKCLVSSLLG